MHLFPSMPAAGQSRKQDKMRNPAANQPRFDSIVGDKQVYYAKTLNYLYLDPGSVKRYFYLGRNKNTVSVKICQNMENSGMPTEDNPDGSSNIVARKPTTEVHFYE